MKLVWGEKLGRPECPYIQRWVLDLGLFSIRLHKWFSSDDGRYLHDHPWWYISWVLKGSYIDISDKKRTVREAGTISYFPSSHRHTVRITNSPCWTLLVTGPEKRDWGFWVGKKFLKRNHYFIKYEHPPCDSDSHQS